MSRTEFENFYYYTDNWKNDLTSEDAGICLYGDKRNDYGCCVISDPYEYLDKAISEIY